MNSSVIQDAPAVMPFTMQAAPATLMFSAKLVARKPHKQPAQPEHHDYPTTSTTEKKKRLKKRR